MTETPATDAAARLDMFQRMPAIDLITKAIGPTVGFHVAGCPDGGYVVIVDGRIRAACTSVVEVMDGVGRMLSGQFGESATDVPIGPGLPRGEVPRALRPRGGAAPIQPGDGAGQLSERVRASASLAMAAIVVIAHAAAGLWGV